MRPKIKSSSDTKKQMGYATLLRPTVTGQVKDNFAFYSDLKFYYLREKFLFHVAFAR